MAVDDIIAGSAPEKWRREAALFGMGLSDDEREEILEPLIADEGEDADTTLLRDCISYMMALKEVSTRGFKRLPKCDLIYWKLLTTERPMLLASMIKAWDLAGGYATAAARGLNLIFGLPVKVLDQLAEHIPSPDQLSGKEYALTRALDPEAQGETAPFPLEDFPDEPLGMPEVVFERRRGREQRFIQVLNEAERSTLREKLRNLRDLFWGGFAFYDGQIKQLGPNAGFPHSITIETEKPATIY